ncbi:hypothetical protein DACRYDRAFT_24939 [Dacryopinax primogenitus]|uniref:Uncharacterized protein n=1 Tax=Dacryopinax primogenitus (strain DJM 731) TaxID=1858805 RepID=M5FQ54_DACPD|nr:uncharacterized protein DACRYDRAFT_24939 [Dacryopinax primogenitus]EJT97533.1 hypothetical protein DACRYDRAFT_24939 [Dacryopinax primogenitus]
MITRPEAVRTSPTTFQQGCSAHPQNGPPAFVGAIGGTSDEGDGIYNTLSPQLRVLPTAYTCEIVKLHRAAAAVDFYVSYLYSLEAADFESIN